MIDLFWFTMVFMLCLLFVAWASEDENMREKAARLSHSREIGRKIKQARNPAPKRATRWCKL